MNRETRSRAFTSAMVGLAILSIIPPLLLAVAQAARSVQLTDAKIIPSHTFHVIGAHRIPAEFTVPATLATLALWMTTQMQVLRDNVRKGCPTRFMTEKGIHFAVTFVWTGCAYLLLKQGGIMPVIEHVTLGVLITTGLGMMWRLAVTRSRPKDPESSIAGYVLPATRAIGNRLNRNGKTSRKSPNNNNPQ